MLAQAEPTPSVSAALAASALCWELGGAGGSAEGGLRRVRTSGVAIRGVPALGLRPRPLGPWDSGWNIRAPTAGERGGPERAGPGLAAAGSGRDRAPAPPAGVLSPPGSARLASAPPSAQPPLLGRREEPEPPPPPAREEDRTPSGWERTRAGHGLAGGALSPSRARRPGRAGERSGMPRLPRARAAAAAPDGLEGSRVPPLGAATPRAPATRAHPDSDPWVTQLPPSHVGAPRLRPDGGGEKAGRVRKVAPFGTQTRRLGTFPPPLRAGGVWKVESPPPPQLLRT
ncbi:sterile alpha motif domain-containing protein 1-like [Manis pentadactyla]|uniref:sterile alpha motif domain-containing protein 1-like n=1 Tax=Manis pentadactyla TaxID=143292 RepID=UPI00255C930D|nr:sterile alpha motif domain-containing protein 1-like [Manis pentadactyla]